MNAADTLARARSLEDSIAGFLASLISIDSRTGREGPLAVWLHERHAELGLESRLFPCGDRYNVVAWIGEGPETILFAGHLDTVPPDERAWTSPPLEPRIADGRMFGLGASDMKASIAAATHALLLLGEDPPPGRVATVWTVDEETTGAGTRRFVADALASGFLDPARTVCVVTEPSGLREIVLGSRGAVFPLLTIRGRSAHGSRPHLARSPIAAARRVLDAAQRIEREWRVRLASPPLAPPTLTPTVLRSGDPDAPNRVPAVARIGFDARLTPPLAADGFAPVRASFDRLVEELRAEGYEAEVELRYGRPGHLIAADHPLAVAALAVAREDLGLDDAAFGYTRAANDACFFQQAGIDTLNKWGPGDPSEAHAADESVSLSRTVQAAAGYALLAQRWLGSRREGR